MRYRVAIIRCKRATADRRDICIIDMTRGLARCMSGACATYIFWPLPRHWPRHQPERTRGVEGKCWSVRLVPRCRRYINKKTTEINTNLIQYHDLDHYQI